MTKSERIERERTIEQMCRQGMRYADIGKELCMTENAVKMAVIRAGLVGVAKEVRMKSKVAMAAEYYRNYGRVTTNELAASLGVNPSTLRTYVWRYREEALQLLRKKGGEEMK